MKTILFIILIILCQSVIVKGQSIVGAEYFFDSDPGVGSGVSLIIVAGDTVNIIDSIPVTSLGMGMHKIGLRFRNNLGLWSQTQGKWFYILDPSTILSQLPSHGILKCEYFYDTDPGVGNGTSLVITPGNTVSIIDSIPVNSLGAGMHKIGLRFKDSVGVWSQSQGKWFYILDPSTILAQNPSHGILTCEYFYDSDPGVGNGTSLVITPGNTVSIIDSIPVTQLGNGMHKIGLRFKDSVGVWSQAQGKWFYIMESNVVHDTAAMLSGYEYFYDTDPGVGNGTKRTIAPPVSQINLATDMQALNLAEGKHTLVVRFVDQNRRWSFAGKDTFNVETSAYLISPLNNSENLSLIPTFLWHKNNAAQSYKLLISRTNNFADTVLNLSGLTDTSYAIASGVLQNATTYYWHVSSVINTIPGFWSEAWNFRTIGDTNLIPVLVSPLNNSIDQPINTTMKWNTVAGAASYSLEVSTDSLFTTTVINQSGISDTTYSANGLIFLTKYYWRVNATNGTQTSNWSQEWSYTTGQQLLPPELLLPANRATGMDLSCRFYEWSDVAGAESYYLQLSTDSTFASYYNFTEPGNTEVMWCYPLLPGTVYYWHARTNYPNGLTSPWSELRHYTTIQPTLAAPVLSSPANNATNQPLNPNMQWQGVTGATSYTLQVSTISDFSTTVVNQSGITDTSHQVSGLSNSTQYFWRVNATNGTITSQWSDVWNFTSKSPSLTDGLIAYYPFNGNANDESGNGNNGTVNGATLTTDRFGINNKAYLFDGNDDWIEVPNNNSFDFDVNQNFTICFWARYPQDQNTNCTWDNDLITKWSNPSQGYPFAIRIINQTDNDNGNIYCARYSSNCNVAPSVESSISYNNNEYHFFVFKKNSTEIFLYADNFIVDSTNDIVNLSCTTTNTSNLYFGRRGSSTCNFFTGALDDIRIYNRSLTDAEILELYNEGTSTLSAPLLTSPLNNATNQPLSPNMQWHSVAGATSYTLQVSTISDFSTTIVNQSGITDTTHQITGLSYNTQYFWRVNATNGTITSNWSEVWNLSTIPPAPPEWNLSYLNYDFGSVMVDSSSQSVLKLVNTGTVAFALDSLVFNNNQFTHNPVLLPLTLTPNDSLVMTITFTPSESGLVNGKLSFIAPGLSQNVNFKGTGRIQTVAPTLTYSTVNPFSGTSGVNPPTGAVNDYYEFRVVYTDAGNFAPLAGYPKVMIDLNGDGNYDEQGETGITMSQVDGSVQNFTVGKEYVLHTQLINAANMHYKFIAKNEMGNDAVGQAIGQAAGPIVIGGLTDLKIFASDIEFSNYHPQPFDEETIFATVHNGSNIDARNVNVRFYIEDALVQEFTIDLLAAHSDQTLSITHFFSVIDFYPIKVWIDQGNQIPESNELNNFAIRPIVVGDFAVPGSIEATASISPNKSCNIYYGLLSFSGHVKYVGGNDPNTNVTGAEVRMTINETGQTTIGHTDVNGNYYFNFEAPGLGNFTISAYVTDYTLETYTDVQTFNVVDCTQNADLPDLWSSVSIPEGCKYLNDFVNGTATIGNSGEIAADNVLVKIYSDNIMIYEHIYPNFAVGQTKTVDFQLNTATVGNHGISVYVDPFNMIDEHSKYDNNSGTNQYVYPHQPDLTPLWISVYPNTPVSGFGTSLGFRITNLFCENSDPTQASVYDIFNGVSTLIGTYPIPALDGLSLYDFSIPDYAFNGAGYHTVKVVVNPVINEWNIDNNENSISVYVMPALAQLSVSRVTPSISNIEAGDIITLYVNVSNNGYADAGDFKVKFYLDNVQIGADVNVSSLAMGMTAQVSKVWSVTSCAKLFKVTVDEYHDVPQYNSDNYSLTSARDFWPDVNNEHPSYHSITALVGSNLFLRAYIHNTGIFDAQNVPVKFYIDGLLTFTDVLPNLNHLDAVLSQTQHLFNMPGDYVVQIVVNDNNTYCESDLSNNTATIYVHIYQDLPDLEIWSEEISPSELNPDPNELVSISASFRNVGNVPTGAFKVRFLVNSVPLGDDIQVNNLAGHSDFSVASTQLWSSPSVGMDIIRVQLDPDLVVNEVTKMNNEASRAIIVGDAPDLAFSATFNKILMSDPNPSIGEQIIITSTIRNRGGADGNGLLSYYLVLGNDTTLIHNDSISVPDRDSIAYSFNWSVTSIYGKIIAKINDVQPIEFNLFNNNAELNYGNPPPPLNVNPIATPSTIWSGQITQLSANANGGTGNYSIRWESNPDGFVSFDSIVFVNPTITTTYALYCSDGQNTIQNFVVVNVYNLTLASPANGSNNQPLTLDLSWNQLLDISSYSVQVSTDADFSNKIFDQSGITVLSIKITGLNNNTQYYWRVNATDGTITSNWSDVWDFTTQANTYTLSNNPESNFAQANYIVSDFALSADGSILYVAGNFTELTNPDGTVVTRNNLASVNVATGYVTAWNPNVTGDEANGSVSRIILSGNILYAAGYFTNVGGVTRNRLAAFDIITGNLTSWDPNADGSVMNLLQNGSKMFVSGFFTSIGGNTQNKLAEVDISTGLTTSFNPNPNDGCAKMLLKDSILYVTGRFSLIGGVSRNYIAAININTGMVTSWNPSPNDGVYTMENYSSILYTCGTFATIGGEPRSNLASLDYSTGNATSWNPGCNQPVFNSYLYNSTLYLVGRFTLAGGISCGKIISFDLTTGNANSWNPIADQDCFAAYVGGNKVFIGGNFNTINGLPRRNIAVFDMIPTNPVPELVSPANNATNQPVNPNMQWQGVTGATSYTLQVSTISDFTTTVVNQSGITDSTHQITGLSYTTQYFWRVNATNGTITSNWSDVWGFSTITNSIILSQGWNMISSFINPSNPDLETMLAEINSKIIIMKNGLGQNYVPLQGINQIGDWNIHDGYQIKVNDTTRFSINGSIVKPDSTPIPLIASWNLISYLRSSPMSIATALSNLGTTIVIAKNGAGQMYVPGYSINQIGNMKPWEGYYLYVNTPGNLFYPENGLLMKVNEEEISPMPKHLVPEFVRTGNNASMILNINAQDGNEVGVYSFKDQLIGSGVVINNIAGITIWGDDEMTPDLEGAMQGESVSLKLYNVESGLMKDLEIKNLRNILNMENSDILKYQKDAVYTGEAVNESSQKERLNLSVIPNPASGKVHISYNLLEQSSVRLSITNDLGVEIRLDGFDEVQSKGNHSIEYDISRFTSGVYIITLSAGNNILTEKLVIVR